MISPRRLSDWLPHKSRTCLVTDPLLVWAGGVGALARRGLSHGSMAGPFFGSIRCQTPHVGALVPVTEAQQSPRAKPQSKTGSLPDALD